MGLFDFLRRSDDERYLAAAAKRPKPTLQAEGDENVTPIGASGTINYRGQLVPDEYNQELTGTRAIDVYTRMWRSDPVIRETLWHIFAPLLNAEKVIEEPGPDPSPVELEATAFVQACFFEWLDQSMDEFLTQALSYLPIGHSVFECLYKVVEKELRVEVRLTDPDSEGEEGEASQEPSDDVVPTNGKVVKPVGKPITAAFPPKEKGEEGEEDGPPDPAAEVAAPQLPEREVRVLPKRQYVTLRKLSQRLPKTITEWNVDDAGELTSIKQMVPKRTENGGQEWHEIPIGAEHLLVFVNEKHGDEWTGTSILRATYKPWVIKEMIEKVAAIAYERHGVGVPVAYVPRDRENDQEIIDAVEDMLKNLRSGEFSYMVFPGPKAQGHTIGYHFEIVSPEGGIPDFTKILEHFRGEIKGALLVRFSELGHGSTGARATANVQSEVWYAALHALARYISSAMDVLIRRLVDINFPDVDRYPKLSFHGLEDRNLLEFAQATALLVNSGLIHTDAPTRAWARRQADAPDEDQDEAKLRSQQEQETFALEKGEKGGIFDIEEDPAETARPRVSKSDTPD
jgi:hypothetical protein